MRFLKGKDRKEENSICGRSARSHNGITGGRGSSTGYNHKSAGNTHKYRTGNYKRFESTAPLTHDRGAAQSGRPADRTGLPALSGKTKLIIALLLVLAISITVFLHQRPGRAVSADKPSIDVELLTVNSYSRPGIPLDKVNGIVVHYTANQHSSALDNRNYFENLQYTHVTKASAHFIIGTEGEIVQCIPTAEIAYASNSRNGDTISIECCYDNDDGSFNTATYNSLVQLAAYLCARFGLTSDDVIRHYDVTGKLCPIYYVKHPDKWQDFRDDVERAYSAA